MYNNLPMVHKYIQKNLKNKQELLEYYRKVNILLYKYYNGIDKHKCYNEYMQVVKI